MLLIWVISAVLKEVLFLPRTVAVLVTGRKTEVWCIGTEVVAVVMRKGI
jgi:hypothetical protein